MADAAKPKDPQETPPGAQWASGSASVFISYASQDNAVADAVCQALEKSGVVCWIAPRDVTPGLFYADAIVQAINAAQILVVVLSVNSVNSQHVLREVERASAKRRPLVAFRVDATALPTGLEYFLSASHWLDVSGGAIDRALSELVTAVRRLLLLTTTPAPGVVPQVATVELLGTVSQSVLATGLPPPAATMPQPVPTFGNLPTHATRLVGRELELNEVLAHLKATRLLTLTGVGGVGKTRLSIQAAAELSTTFPDGVWLVELAAVADPGAVCHAVAGVVGVAQQSGKTLDQSIIAALAGRHLLLILDNCEHLIESVATLANAILTGCPHVTLLATSREALMIDGEQIWPVPSLSFQNGGDSPAVELFVERARAVAPTFEIGEHSQTVSEICGRLDGIPLAIELAAARVRALSPEQIRDRLNERFKLLTGGARRTLERHQTLRHAVQWSYDLLSGPERAVLSRASVFAGGFTLSAAERVCSGEDVSSSTILDVIDSLVRKSLVSVERTGNVVRYAMLETIRQYGEERLTERGEGDAARKRHAEFCADDSDRIFKIWRSSGEPEAYKWFDQEISNIRIGFRWAVEQSDVDAAARIASNIGDMARFRLREDTASWPQEIVDKARATRHRRLAVLLTWCASNAWASSRFHEAKCFGEEAISLRNDPAFDLFIWAFADLAFVAMFEGDVDRAIQLLQTASEHPADQLDRFHRALLLYFLGTAGRREEAAALADDIVREVNIAGVPISIALAYIGKGSAVEETDPVAGLSAYEHAVAVARAAGNRMAESLAISRVAALHARSGASLVALQGFARMLNSHGDATDLAFVATWRASLVVLLAKLGHFEAAATLDGTLPASVDAKSVIAEYPDAVTRVRQALGSVAFDESFRRGAAMAFREGSTYAKDQVRCALQVLDVP